MYKHRLLNTLRSLIVLGNFKTAKDKFLSKGIESPVIDKYFDAFKKLRDRHRILEVEKKNIDYWANLSFEDFKKFIDSLNKEKSKREQKGLTRKSPWKFDYVEGATKVGENNDWVVYKVDTYKAATKLGTRNWCIVRDPEIWDDYNKNIQFYFILSKKRSYNEKEVERKREDVIPYEDPYHRFALSVESNGKEVWYDAADRRLMYDSAADPSTQDPALQSIPDFKVELPETLMARTVKLIREQGLTPEAKSVLEEEFPDFNVHSYDKEKDSLILDSFNDISDFVKHSFIKNRDLKWLTEALDDFHVDISGNTNEEINIVETILDMLKKKNENLYNKILIKIFKNKGTALLKYVDENYDFNLENIESIEEKLAYLKKQKHFTSILSNFLSEIAAEFVNICWRINSYAIEAATYKEITEQLLREMKENPYLIVHENHLWGPISLTIKLKDLLNDPRDVYQDMKDSLESLGFDNYDYAYPDDDQLFEQIDNEGSMDEWLKESTV